MKRSTSSVAAGERLQPLPVIPGLILTPVFLMEPAVPPVSQHCVENDYGCGFNLCSGQSHD